MTKLGQELIEAVNEAKVIASEYRRGYERGLEDAIKAVWEEVDEYTEGQIGQAIEDRIRRLKHREE